MTTTTYKLWIPAVAGSVAEKRGKWEDYGEVFHNFSELCLKATCEFDSGESVAYSEGEETPREFQPFHLEIGDLHDFLRSCCNRCFNGHSDCESESLEECLRDCPYRENNKIAWAEEKLELLAQGSEK